MFDFGCRIKELREQHKMSQEQLGRRIDRSKSVISSYENNIKIPPLDILTKIAVMANQRMMYAAREKRTKKNWTMVRTQKINIHLLSLQTCGLSVIKRILKRQL